MTEQPTTDNIYVIGSSLHATHTGRLKLEFLYDNGAVYIVYVTGIYMPHITCCLYIPHNYFSPIKKPIGKIGFLQATWYKAILHITYCAPIYIEFY